MPKSVPTLTRQFLFTVLLILAFQPLINTLPKAYKLLLKSTIGLYTPLQTTRTPCHYLSGLEILEVKTYLLQHTVISDALMHY
jgi:hypothetical protein